MSEERQFPVLDQRSQKDKQLVQFPRSVPWSLLAPHEKQALKNHDQNLETLAERGGLSPCEILAVVEDRSWKRIPDAVAVLQLLALGGVR